MADQPTPEPADFDADASAPVPASSTVYNCTAAAAILVLLVNAALLVAAVQDRSWLALAIAIVYGPAANAALALVGLVALRIIKRSAQGAPLRPFILAAIVLPLAAIAVDFFFICALDLHGC